MLTKHMGKLASVGFTGLALMTLYDVMLTLMKRKFGGGVHKQTLRQILLAPVNNFFDVTPIGKILNIFTRNMNVFYGELLEPVDEMLNMASHLIVVIGCLLAIGSWSIVLPGLFVTFWLMREIARPYLIAEIQMDKIRSILWTPIHSFFHESMRGKSVIRAFEQEATIMARQNTLFDNTTLSFIPHYSAYKWFQMRMLWATMLIPCLTIVTCAQAKGTVSESILVVALFYSLDIMSWMYRFFDNYNHFQRMMVSV